MLAVDPRTVGVGAVGAGHVLDPAALNVASVSGGAFNGDTGPFGTVFLGWGFGLAGHAGSPHCGGVVPGDEGMVGIARWRGNVGEL
ncbi:hypothetical protein D3C81_1781930 [compost metagenome]